MMTEHCRNERIFFRIVGLEEKLLQDYREYLGISDVKTKRYKDTDTFVVSFQMNRNCDFGKLIDFVQTNKIKESSYGIYVSLVTENDHDGVSLPRYALELHKKIGGHIDFSFTCV